MRLLFIVHQFMPEFYTGTELVTFQLAKAAQRSGHSVTVLTCSLMDGSLWRGVNALGLRWHSVNGVPVFAIPSELIGDPIGFQQTTLIPRVVNAFLATEQFELAHVMHSLRMLGTLNLLSKLGVPYIISLTDFFTMCYRINLVRKDGGLCGGPNRGRACNQYCTVPDADIRRRHQLFHRILANAEERVACSPFVQQLYRREYPNLAFRVIPHGIDLISFAKVTYKKLPGQVIFGYLGTISAMKGTDTLVEAFHRVTAPNARLEVVGPVYENTGVFAKIKRVAEKDPRISIREAVRADQVPDVLAQFDVLCIPSKVPETFSLVLHQGFAAGIPAMVSDLGNLGELIKSSGAGCALPANDVNAWSAAIGKAASSSMQLEIWRSNIPTPLRIEEEAFFYDQIYRSSLGFPV